MRDLSSQNGAETSTGSQTGRSPHARGCRRPKPPLAHSTAHSRGVSHRSALQLLWVPNRGQDSGTSAPVWTAERKHESEVRRSPPPAEAAGRTGSEIRALRPAALPHSRQSLSLASGEADSWGAAGCGAEAAGVWLSAHSSSCPRPAPRNCFHSRRAATSGSDTQDGGWGFPRDFLRKPVKVGCRLRGPGTLAN